MKIDVRLLVYLKGADLVASTAFLTLTEKLDLSGKLLGLRRFDDYALRLGADAPQSAVGALRRVLGTRSTFYNRNKHNYLLECHWEGGAVHDGTTREELNRRFLAEVLKNAQIGEKRNFRSQRAGKPVIFYGGPVFRVDVLVEDQDTAGHSEMAGKLQSELAAFSVTVSAMGTRWSLAIRADTEDEAGEMAESIAVARERKQGLLLNPNFQKFTVVALEEMEFDEDG